ncbi:MAG: hypothetical protein LBG23_03540 [Endomicrobium sp.]|nr:hypothetical protein [Endomicrobium sp.]
MSLKCNYTTEDEGEKGELTFKSKMQSIPVTVYYKYEFKDSKFSVLGSVGLTIIDMKWTSTDNYNNTQSKRRMLSKSKRHLT